VKLFIGAKWAKRIGKKCKDCVIGVSSEALDNALIA
jgi:hypothetical protein